MPLSFQSSTHSSDHNLSHLVLSLPTFLTCLFSYPPCLRNPPTFPFLSSAQRRLATHLSLPWRSAAHTYTFIILGIRHFPFLHLKLNFLVSSRFPFLHFLQTLFQARFMKLTIFSFFFSLTRAFSLIDSRSGPPATKTHAPGVSPPLDGGSCDVLSGMRAGTPHPRPCLGHVQ